MDKDLLKYLRENEIRLLKNAKLHNDKIELSHWHKVAKSRKKVLEAK